MIRNMDEECFARFDNSYWDHLLFDSDECTPMVQCKLGLIFSLSLTQLGSYWQWWPIVAWRNLMTSQVWAVFGFSKGLFPFRASHCLNQSTLDDNWTLCCTSGTFFYQNVPKCKHKINHRNYVSNFIGNFIHAMFSQRKSTWW